MPTTDGQSRRLSDRLVRIGQLPWTVSVMWVMTLLYIGLLAAAVYYARYRTDSQLHSQLGAISCLLADRAALSLDVVDGLLHSLAKEVDAVELEHPDQVSPARRAELEGMLGHRQLRNAGIVSLAMASAAGYRLASAPDSAQGQRITRLEYYRALSTGARDVPLLWSSEARPDGIRRVHMARRVYRPDGHVAGAIVAELDLTDSIGDVSNNMGLEAKDFLSLHDLDNGVLAAYLAAANSGAEASGVSLVSQAIAQSKTEGISHAISTSDGYHRVFAYRKLPRYPLYLVYGKDVGNALAIWKYELAAVVLAGLISIAVSALVTVGIRRHVAVAQQLDIVRGHLKESNRALRIALAATELMAAKDQLTDLWNRRTFDQRLKESVAHQERHEGTFSLLLIDIDHFKRINDRYGHMAGDDVLRRFADVLRERLRQNDVAARWGGEEFAVLADGASLENGRLLAEQIRGAVADEVFPGAESTTVSIGVAEFGSGENEDDLLQRADQALYEAKRLGRNRVAVSENGSRK